MGSFIGLRSHGLRMLHESEWNFEHEEDFINSTGGLSATTK